MSGTTDAEAEDKRLTLVENEGLKLTAAMLNGVAVSCVVLGDVTPVLAWAYHLSNVPAVETRLLLCVFVGSLGFGLLLHAAGRLVLGQLK